MRIYLVTALLSLTILYQVWGAPKTFLVETKDEDAAKDDDAANKFGLPDLRNFGKSCYWNGKYYKEHESIPYGDGCNSCLCDNGDVMYCTEMGCKNDSRKPNEDGEDYNADEYYNAYEEYQDYKPSPNPTPSSTFNNCADRAQTTGECLGRKPPPKTKKPKINL